MPLTSERVAYGMSRGRSQGDFQVGALKYLYEHVSSRPYIVAGTSVGAVNGAVMAEGDDDSYAKLADIWLNHLRQNSDLYEFVPRDFRARR